MGDVTALSSSSIVIRILIDSIDSIGNVINSILNVENLDLKETQTQIEFQDRNINPSTGDGLKLFLKATKEKKDKQLHDS